MARTRDRQFSTARRGGFLFVALVLTAIGLATDALAQGATVPMPVPRPSPTTTATVPGAGAPAANDTDPLLQGANSPFAGPASEDAIVDDLSIDAGGPVEEGVLVETGDEPLDGGSGEISLGGSRLNRFMKDVENVTGHMGEGEAVTAAEEFTNAAAMAEPAAIRDDVAETTAGTGDTTAEREASEQPSPSPIPDPWQALVQVGAQFVSALAASGNPSAPAHPWIERDPATGARNLKVPLPPPETAKRLADVLSVLAERLRGDRH